MKISKNFMVKKILEDYVIIPAGSDLVDFNAMITTNETGAFLWELLQQERTLESLTQALCQEYAIDAPTAQKDAEEFLELLKKANILE